MKKSILNTYLLQIINVLFSFFLSIFIARILSPSERGELILFTTSTTFFSLLLEFSLGTAITYYIASGKYPVSETLSLIILWCILVSFTTCIAVFISPYINFQQFLFASGNNPFFVNLSFIGTVVFGMACSLLSALFTGKKMFSINNTITLINLIVTFFIYGSFFILNKYFSCKFSSQTIIIISFLILSLRLLAIIFYNKKLIGIAPSRKIFNKNIIKPFLSLSIINYCANTIQFLSFRMDFWFVNYFNGNKELGIYSLAVNLSQLFWLLPNAVGTILYPTIASLPNSEALKYTQKLCRLIFSSTIVLGTIGAVILTFLLPYIYGEQYAPASQLIYILLIGILPYSLTIIITTYYAGMKRNIINLLASIIGFLVCLISDIILIPKFGTKGASIATVLTYTANTIFIVLIFTKENNSKLSLLLLPHKDDFKLLKSILQINKKQ